MMLKNPANTGLGSFSIGGIPIGDTGGTGCVYPAFEGAVCVAFAPASRTCRQGSQNIPVPTIRAVSFISGLPQSWQNPTRSLLVFVVVSSLMARLTFLGSSAAA